MIVVVPENSIQRMRALRPDRAQSRCLLVLLTATAVIVLPIQTGVAIGIGLALVHGVFMTTRTRPVELQKLPGTTVWWPTGGSEEGANQEGVAVIAFQAPLLFANAPTFKRSMIEMIDRYEKQPGLVVLEASGIADIDFTAARALMDVIQHCRAINIGLPSRDLNPCERKRRFDRFGILADLGAAYLFHSVDEAVKAHGPGPRIGTNRIDRVRASSPPTTRVSGPSRSAAASVTDEL